MSNLNPIIQGLLDCKKSFPCDSQEYNHCVRLNLDSFNREVKALDFRIWSAETKLTIAQAKKPPAWVRESLWILGFALLVVYSFAYLMNCLWNWDWASSPETSAERTNKQKKEIDMMVKACVLEREQMQEDDTRETWNDRLTAFE